jgi:hypothetical protein
MVYQMPMKYLELVKCPSGRFDNFTTFTEGIGLEGNYWCLENSTIVLEGSLASSYATLIFLNIAECNQTTLDHYSPGKTCATDPDEIFTAL